MNPKERRENFYKRWNITTTENEQEKFINLKKRVLNHLDDRFLSCLWEYSCFELCQTLWISIRNKTILWPFWNYTEKDYSVIIKYFQDIASWEDLYYFLEEVCVQSFEKKDYKNEFIEKIIEIIDFSNLSVRIERNETGIIFYPKWEEILDENLVNWPLSFLSDNINQKFQNALNFYLQKNYIKSCEECRRALEEFLREKLWNTKWLAENIKELSKELKINDSITDMRNITFQNFNFIDKYFNENSKHNDGDLQDFDNEFVIYQTGLLMRYIENFFQK